MTRGSVEEGRPFSGRVALVTGASSGVGRAISIALSRVGAQLCAVGRNRDALMETVAVARQHSEARGFQIDLAREEGLGELVSNLKALGRLDILVHSAGVMHLGPMRNATVEDLDVQFATNVRAPYLLTQQLLPLLKIAPGQVVFINSSAGLAARRDDTGQYAATKHALKAIADSLREEVNRDGIRVLSVYPGRIATPMQEAICSKEGRAYDPAALLQPEDIATFVVQALTLPFTAEVTDISIRPMRKSY